MGKRLSDAEIDRYVANFPPAVKELVRATREFILAQVPDADEQLKWGQPWYERNGPIAYVGAFTAHVNLGFPRGSEMSDRFPILEGTGKAMRHIKVCVPEDLQNPVVAAVLQAAAALNG
jgi:hypothetical protein